jgi:hypothetical protein
MIDFLEGGKENVSLLLDLNDKVDLAYNIISLIKSAKDEDGEADEEDDKQGTQSKLGLEVGNQQQQELIMDEKTFCSSCEAPNDLEASFCSKCGNKLFVEESASDEPPPQHLLESYRVEKEKAFFKAEGEVMVRRTEHRGGGRKIASWLAGGPIGYVALGRDKTRKTKAKGTLVVTDKAIYCAGNVYPYDMVLAFTRKRKSIMLLFEKSFNEQRFSVNLELRTNAIKELFRALEMARMSKIKF